MSDSRAIHSSLSSRLLSVLPCYADGASERAPVTGTRSVLASLAGPAWDAAAMFAGTGAWLAVYYAGPSFAKMDDDGPMSFILHCIAMGVTANFVVLPLVKRNHLSRGETNRQANAEIKKYFILCTIPDVLYEPVADWLAAMSTKGGVTGIDFKKYADPNFDAAEVSGAIVLFGLGFGSIYYLGGKFLERNSAEKEADAEIKFHADDTSSLRISRKVLEVYETNAMSAGIAALQYFIFYLTDYLFDVDWYSFEETMPQILGMCAMMGAYTFLFDAGPVFLRALIEKLEAAPEDPLAYHLLTGDAISNEVRVLFPAERNRRPSNSGFFENRNQPRSGSTAIGTLPGAAASMSVATNSLIAPANNDTAVTVRNQRM
jgi:hypothetical protein